MDTTMEVPALQLGDTIVNNYPVIAMEEMRTNDPRVRSYIVIALRKDHPLHKYVVWEAYKCSWDNEEGYRAQQGDYYETLEEAQVRFNKRAGI